MHMVDSFWKNNSDMQRDVAKARMCRCEVPHRICHNYNTAHALHMLILQERLLPATRDKRLHRVSTLP